MTRAARPRVRCVLAWALGVALTTGCAGAGGTAPDDGTPSSSASSASSASTASTAIGSTRASSGTVAPTALPRVLLVNLCNSGEAGCYSGRAVAHTAELIRTETPDVVALNEICEDDIASLTTDLDELAADDVVVSAFEAAGDPRSGTDYRCGRNGERYGIGILARLPESQSDHTTRSGVYPAQDRADPELRVWVCLDAVEAFVACTTHLVNTVPAIALAQCDQLMSIAFGDRTSRPTVVAGDLNLRVGGPTDLLSCLPSGKSHVDNGGALHVVTDVAIAASRSLDMAGTSDHPALLVGLGR